MTLLEYPFVIPNDLMNLGSEHQCCRKHKRIDKLTLVTSWQKMRAPPVFLKKKKKKNKIPRNKFNQGGRRPVHWKLQEIDERDWRRHK